jgi:hypothetical protein
MLVADLAEFETGHAARHDGMDALGSLLGLRLRLDHDRRQLRLDHSCGRWLSRLPCSRRHFLVHPFVHPGRVITGCDMANIALSRKMGLPLAGE